MESYAKIIKKFEGLYGSSVVLHIALIAALEAFGTGPMVVVWLMQLVKVCVM